jgi:hypothetical protein
VEVVRTHAVAARRTPIATSVRRCGVHGPRCVAPNLLRQPVWGRPESRHVSETRLADARAREPRPLRARRPRSARGRQAVRRRARLHPGERTWNRCRAGHPWGRSDMDGRRSWGRCSRGGSQHPHSWGGQSFDVASWSAETGEETLGGEAVGTITGVAASCAPGTGGAAFPRPLDALRAYRLRPGSPLIDTAIHLRSAGMRVGARDFFGNPVPGPRLRRRCSRAPYRRDLRTLAGRRRAFGSADVPARSGGACG